MNRKIYLPVLLLIVLSKFNMAQDSDAAAGQANNPQRNADLSSRKDLIKNSDGSVDLYFGPSAPAGKEKNWVQTMAGKHWFAYMRFYGPTVAYFDKSWKMDDIEKVK